MTAATADVKLTARDLANAIRNRYEAPEWHVEDEVTLAGRRLDLVALNLWTTRAHRIVGFEIKVSRGDWMRELDAFQKSEDWCAVVDAFYVVTPPNLGTVSKPRSSSFLEYAILALLIAVLVVVAVHTFSQPVTP